MTFLFALKKFNSAIEAAYGALLPEQVKLVAEGKLQWKYLDNPAAAGLVSCCVDGDEIIGLVGFVPALMKVGNRKVIGFQALDTVVSPLAQGKFAFVRMAQTFYKEVPKTVGLVYGFPNAAAARGWFGRLGWTNIGRAPFLVKPLRASYVLKRYFPKWVDFPLSFFGREIVGVERLDAFDESVDVLWEKFSTSIACAVERDSRYLNWRLFQHPTSKYETWAIRDKAGAVRSFVTTNCVVKHGGNLAYIMEAMGDDTLDKLLAHVLVQLRRAKVEVVLAWCRQGSPNYSVFRKIRFFPIPERIQPITLHFGAKALLADLNIVTKKDSWYLSYLDSDTV